MTLADITIDGRERKVLMQAPKNGFFYVLDRVTGELLSAEPYAHVTWAKGIDMATGRPIENEGVRYPDGAIINLSPGPGGTHNWHPMSWNPGTGLMYIPGQDSTSNYGGTPNYEFAKGRWNTGVSGGQPTLPSPPAVGSPAIQGQNGFLVAWDPVTQQERWRVTYQPGFNGGTVTTAGNLVFHGTADGRLIAYRADTGDKLWEMDLGVRNMASPITYELDGTQYVAILGGRAANPAAGLRGGAGAAGQDQSGPGPKLFLFALDGARSVEDASTQ
jgi:quinohemoprotein ethanol dehydrogenase